MSRYIEERWPFVEGPHEMRMAFMDTLTDADLTFSPGGWNMTLGALCREIGETEQSYIDSLKTLKQDWAYRNTDPGLDISVERLKAWYAALDADLKATVAAFSDDDLKQIIERGFPVPRHVQIDIYVQALLIFFGKATIFVKALDKPLTPMVQDWIG